MATLIQYRKLFSVEIIPEYYFPEESALFSDMTDEMRDALIQEQLNTYQLAQDLFIYPTHDCQVLLDQNKMVFKRTAKGFFIASKVEALNDGSFVPYHSMNEAFSLNFAIAIQNNHFINFTNLRMGNDEVNGAPYIYRLSNRANNVVNTGTEDLLHLSQSVPAFDPAVAYEASELIMDPNGGDPIMYEAIQNNGPGAFDINQWQEIYSDLDPLPQFVTSADRLRLRPGIFKHQVSAAGQEELTFALRDEAGNTVSLLHFQTSEAGTPLSECELDLSDIAGGYYELEVSDSIGTPIASLSMPIYLDNKLYQSRPLAVIECFHEPSGSLAAYRWLDHTDGNRLLSPNYVLRWKNRSTYWRYYYSEVPNYTSAEVDNLDANPNSPNHNILISNMPLGLAAFGRRLEIEVGGEAILLPNPEATSIFPENGRIYSEINMGGGLGPPE